jgi:hypothetical protein
VFVTGSSWGSTTADDYATIAYDATTGDPLWTKRYDGTLHSFDSANALAVDPDGSAVFVTGKSAGSTSGSDFETIAYSVT